MNTSQDPYTPPQATQAEVPLLTTDGKITPIMAWARLAQTSLLLYSGLAFTTACANLLRGFHYYEGYQPPEAILMIVDTTLDASEVLQFGFLATIILYSIWVYKATENTIQLQSTNSPLSATPGYAVIQYFVPILNLWKPYTNMKEIWQVCIGSKGTPLILIWWLSWMSNLIVPIFLNAPDEYHASTWRASATERIICSVLTLIAAISLVTIINRLSKKQSNAKLSNEVETKSPQT